MKPSERIMQIIKRDYMPRDMEHTAALEMARQATELSNAIVTFLDEWIAPPPENL